MGAAAGIRTELRVFMDRTRLSKVQALFDDLAGRDRAQRDALLDAACAGDGELRALVERMLDSDDSDMNGFLRQPVFAAGGGGAPPPAEAPAVIGSYEIVRTIGEGGMGIVYEARQREPRRTVALKVIRSALPSRETLRRFRHEAEILARLRHPGIAHVYEAGVTQVALGGGIAATQPYLAMEFVEGRPLRRHAEEEGLPARQRLELMARVCDAVQHAHEKGVIHRDLKSDNLLVDAGGQPKILDFGVARLVDPDGADLTRHTRAGEIVGTLAYMSPEQVGGADVDTRSDVYSLGVILYELLAGRLPHDVRGVPLAEAARRIQEVPAPPLSSLSRAYRGDVETIVARAMHRARERRYESAAALAGDLRRHLRAEPIEARRDSAVYVLGRTLRRYRWAVAAFAASIASLTAFSFYAEASARRSDALARAESEARQQAEAATERAQRAHAAETEQRRLAEAQARRAETVTAFLVDTLGLADPDITQVGDMSMQGVLDRAAAQVGGAFADAPVSEAAVRLVIGRAYATLGDPHAAREHLARALELRTGLDAAPEELYEVLWPYVQVLHELSATEWRTRWWQLWRLVPSRMEGADPELIAAFNDFREQTNAAYDPETALPVEQRLFELAEARLPAADPRWMVIADQLYLSGWYLTYQDVRGAGHGLLQRALAIQRRFLPETHTRIIHTLGELVRTSIDAGDGVEAERLTRESLELLRKTLRADHWYLAFYEAMLGASLAGQGRHEEAEKLLIENLARVDAARGGSNAHACEIVIRLIDLYEAWNRPEEAGRWRLSLADRAVRSEQHNRPNRVLLRMFGPEHEALRTLLRRFNRQRNSAAGVSTLEQLTALRRETLADDDLRSAVIAECLCAVAVVVTDFSGPDESTRKMLEEAEALARACPDMHPRKRAWIFWNLARTLEPSGAYDAMETLSREGLALLNGLPGRNEDMVTKLTGTLGGALRGLGRLAEAEPLLRHAFESQLAADGANSAEVRDSLQRLISLYAALGRPGDAVPSACAVARVRWLDWSIVEPLLSGLHPALAEALARLNAVAPEDVDAVREALAAVRAARAACMDVSDPLALVYAGTLHTITRRQAGAFVDPAWMPSIAESREILAAHGLENSLADGQLAWWLATFELSRGAVAAAEGWASLSRRIELTNHPGYTPVIGSRDPPLGAAQIALGRPGEGLPLLLAALAVMAESSAPREPHWSEAFGYVLHASDAGLDAAATVAATEALHAAVSRRRAPAVLLKLARQVAGRPGRAAELYESARQAARAAEESSEHAGRARLVGAALELRLGRRDAAAALWDALPETPSGDAVLRGAIGAMIAWERGEAVRAAALLDAARSRLGDRGEAASAYDAGLVEEAEARLASPPPR